VEMTLRIDPRSTLAARTGMTSSRMEANDASRITASTAPSTIVNHRCRVKNPGLSLALNVMKYVLQATIYHPEPISGAAINFHVWFN
jgi:hypothetical protein